MRRALRIVGIIAGGLLLLVMALALFLNIGPGRLTLEAAVNRFTPLRIEGLSGRFPERLRVARLTVTDAAGPWLVVEDLAVDWSPFRLLRRHVSIQSLTARRIAVSRLPASAPGPTTPTTPGQATLPVRVTIGALDVATLDLGPALLGTGARFTATGRVELPALTTGDGALTLVRQDAPGRYALTLSSGKTLSSALSIDEPAGGLLGTLAGLSPGAPIAARATLAGPAGAAVLALNATAGPLALQAGGTIDLLTEALDVQVHAASPAMAVAGVAWEGAALDATVRGPWTGPGGTAQFRLTALHAPGASLRELTASATAPGPGRVQFRATVAGLALDAAPGLFDAAPVQLTADADLAAPRRPVAFSVTHPLAALAGTIEADTLAATATLDLPALNRLAALAGVDVQGQAALRLAGNPGHVTIDGTTGVTAGIPYAGLIGPAATLGLTLDREGQRLTVSRLLLDGKALHVSGQGTLDQAMLDATTEVTLASLGTVAPGWTGALKLDATATGRLDAIAIKGLLAGTVGAPGQRAEPLSATIDASGLPGAPVVLLSADGTLAGAPLTLAAELRQAAGVTRVAIEHARWKSVQAAGTLELTPVQQGTATVEIGALSDIAALVGGPSAASKLAAGKLAARLTLAPETARLEMTLDRLTAATVQIARAHLDATVKGTAHPVIAGTLVLDGVNAGQAGGRARIEANGPVNAVAVRANGSGLAAGSPVNFDLSGTVDGPARIVRLAALTAGVRGESIRLLAPATVRLADGVSIDRLLLGARQSELEVAGRISPTLNATARLRAGAPALALVPGLLGQGSVTIDAKLAGLAAAPTGTVRVQAVGLRAAAAPQAPPLSLDGTAQLAGGAAQVTARAQAGTATLNASGRVPLGAGALDMRLTGALDLAVLDVVLAAEGRRVTGRVALEARVGGTLAAPAPAGTATLSNASIEDFAQGLRISAIGGTIQADGSTLRVAGLRGQAGPGTIAIDGTAGLGAGTPLDLVIRLAGARPLASDRLTADLDGTISIKGPAAGPTIAGRILVRGAELRIPERLPASIAVLNVQRPGVGQAGIGQTAPSTPATLDIRIDVPGAVFVRGRGLDAELGGAVVLQGTTAAPIVNGGLQLRRGTLNAAGTVLNFTRGRIGFDGVGLSGKIDPTLDFVATSSTSAVTASINVGGYASAPKITFTSVPDLPQDEVLAYLLFKRSAKELGPLQLAQIAAAIAQLTGVGGGADPLGRLQRGLGLDRLSVNGGSAASGTTRATGPSVEAGRYVAPGVYVGAKQSINGGQTAAQVQIDLAPGLKAQTEVGTGAGGSSVGLSYEFEY